MSEIEASAYKERVLLVHNFYQIGGGEHTVFENEKRLLIENGHYIAEYTRDNVELNHSFLKKILLPLSAVFSLKTYFDVRKLIRSGHIDVVHCHNTFPLVSPSVYYAARRLGVPVIQTIHNFRLVCPNGVLSMDGKPCEKCIEKGLRFAIQNRCYRSSKLQTIVLVNMLRIHRLLGTYKKIYYIFLTEFNKEKFKLLLGDWIDRQFVKPNFEYIDCCFLSEQRDESVTNERENAWVYIGRLEKEKGIDFLLKVWETEKERDVYIMGSGKLQTEVEEACRKNKKLHYLGFQSKKVILEQLRKSRGLIFPTDLYEGFPMTIIESFAMGTPVICSDIGNGADIVKKHNAGIPYTIRDENAFYAALDKVDNNFHEFSKNAYKAYIENYTPKRNYQFLKSIYEEVTNEY